MQAFEFEIDVKHNLIEIPLQYSQLYSKHVKVIVLMADNPAPTQTKYDFSHIAGRLEWQGDAVQTQRKIRDEW